MNLGRTCRARHLSVHMEVYLMQPSCLCTAQVRLHQAALGSASATLWTASDGCRAADPHRCLLCCNMHSRWYILSHFAARGLRHPSVLPLPYNLPFVHGICRGHRMAFYVVPLTSACVDIGTSHTICKGWQSGSNTHNFAWWCCVCF